MANILIVDDDADARESLAVLLRDSGHTATCVPNGREALARVLADVPDVVLLDLLMPDMDGPSFLEVVRSYLRIQSLPVVVFTCPPSPCGYLPDRTWSLTYEVVGSLTAAEYQRRLEAGWRRFGFSMFSPTCPSCQKCLSLRVPVAAFKPDRAQKRCLAANDG